MNKFKNHKGLIFICKHKYAAVDIIINVGFEFQIVLKYKILVKISTQPHTLIKDASLSY